MNFAFKISNSPIPSFPHSFIPPFLHSLIPSFFNSFILLSLPHPVSPSPLLISVRMSIPSFPNFRARTAVGLASFSRGGAVLFPRVGGPGIFRSLQGVLLGTAYPGLLLVNPYRVIIDPVTERSRSPGLQPSFSLLQSSFSLSHSLSLTPSPFSGG